MDLGLRVCRLIAAASGGSVKLAEYAKKFHADNFNR